MTIKTALHPRNIHRSGYDFAKLIKAHPPLSALIIKNKYNQQNTIDFSNANAVKALNEALLKAYYQIEYWDFPQGYLCPPIPGRVDYIHYIADLLKESGITTKPISILDIGTGASCIYPILGAREYGWQFVASDIDPVSVDSANTNVNRNKTIAKYVTCRLQKNRDNIFHGIINAKEYYHVTMCNPPFHQSIEDANTGTNRKWQNLQKGKKKINGKALNFGGQKAELWCHGGEVAFIRKMISESKKYQNQVHWFTCLISKKDNLPKIKLFLKKAQASQVKVVNMAQGQKTSRFIAWNFSVQ